MTANELVVRLAEALISDQRGRGRPLVVGVTGPDASGKSQLAAALQRAVEARGQRITMIHVDDFHHPRAVRYAGDLPDPDKYLVQSIDFDRLIAEVLSPIRRHGSLRCSLRHLDIATDSWSVERRYEVDADTMVLVEGVFLLRPPVRELIDRLVYLDVDEEILVARGAHRDRDVHGAAAETKFRHKFLPAQRRTVALHPPHSYADVIVDNNDWTAPTVTSWRLP